MRRPFPFAANGVFLTRSRHNPSVEAKGFFGINSTVTCTRAMIAIAVKQNGCVSQKRFQYRAENSQCAAIRKDACFEY